jgi:polysaccharide biosynthesis protein PslH
MKLLVITPVASHPTTQGNSARIEALCRAWQTLGHEVHLLYHALEGLTPAQHEAMAWAWDGLQVVPCTKAPPGPGPGGVHGLDDWFDPEVGRVAAALHERLAFDAVVVNYVWMSAAFEALPPSLPRLLDTHDLFGDRAAHFAALGLPPAWFHTSVEEERRGLARAHRVIAIQSEEAMALRERLRGSTVEVHTVGHLQATRFLPVRPRTGPLRVGYVGSGNPFNVAAMQQLQKQLRQRPELRAGCEFQVGGAVCHALAADPGPFVLQGMVHDLAAFYSGVDLVLNPMPGGTGLKIKTIEALSFGLPVIGTRDAWAGIVDGAVGSLHSESGEPLDVLAKLLESPEDTDRLRRRCRQLFIDYQRREHDNLTGLLDFS